MLTRLARSYISIIVGCGAIVLGVAVHQLHIANPGIFAILGLLAIIGGGLKIRVPGIDGTLSLSFVPLILGAVLLSLPQAILITSVAVLAQVTVFAKKFRWVQAAFNCGALILSVTFAGLMGGLLAGQQVELIRLALVGGIFYLTNSVLVTTVIGLAEDRPVREIYNDCSRLYLPYFAAGLGCALLAISGVTPDERRALQYPGLVILPAMLLTRHYFNTFFTRQPVR